MAFEKVNPSHPDKVADRIAGALVDLAYKKQENPKVAIEVLIGHGNCHIIAETSVNFSTSELEEITSRIADGDLRVDYLEVPQDPELAKNQAEKLRCGDNGIFKGVLTNAEERALSETVRDIYEKLPTDGKFVFDRKSGVFIACQSNASVEDFADAFNNSRMSSETLSRVISNPLGPWTGGTDVDTGATNRKLGSDMGRAVTGGGLHGKDLSKADVSVNIACHIFAQKFRATVDALCAIGDEKVTFKFHRAGYESAERTLDYSEVIEMAKNYIDDLGGFEKLAEWGLI